MRNSCVKENEGEHRRKPESAEKSMRERNVLVAMIKSSLLADLPEVPSKERGKTPREFVWLPFTRLFVYGR